MSKWTLAALAAVVTFGTAVPQASASYLLPQMQIVASFYPKYLHRKPDDSGMNYWRKEILKGVPVQEIEARLIASPEYYKVHGNCNAGFVHGLVEDLFGGPVHPMLIAKWTARLNACGCRVTVAREALAVAALGGSPGFAPAPQPVYQPPIYQQQPPIHHYDHDHDHGFAPVQGHNHNHQYGPGGGPGFGKVYSAPVVVPGQGFYRPQYQPQPGVKIQLKFGF
jgi:hypothetical protein